jgi:hypothetical protein
MFTDRKHFQAHFSPFSLTLSLSLADSMLEDKHSAFSGAFWSELFSPPRGDGVKSELKCLGKKAKSAKKGFLPDAVQIAIKHS